MALRHLHLLLVFCVFGVDAAVFTLKNGCGESIWPGIQPGSGTPQLMDGGFELRPGESVDITAPEGWSGRFWGRRRCSFDDSGKGSCVTGDCGGVLKCAGAGGAPPATLAEFTLDSPCKTVRCVSDLNQHCPKDLQVLRDGRVVACNSACMAFNKPEYCCSGAFSTPDTCKPTEYSKVFKASCPTSYSYAYDDPTSTFTCKGANYLIRFC
ncbi:unnamed protein product, partial [Vitis vinifera]|uniref:Thaumatin-like protein n=1 Tax=Vitis vinifera TaxID=29760 RepID=D7T2X4_VITVI